MKLAIVMCSHNRKNLTKRSILQLNQSVMRCADVNCKIYVCDDGSTDGTPEMLKESFENVVLLTGTGKLYWCKSMHMAMKEAVKENYDFYLMVNDDTDFKDNAIQIMLESYEQAGKSCGIVGSMFHEGDCTYGGRNADKILLQPNGRLQECIWANWNCFLVDKEVVKQVGIIDGKYQHACGDFDYSYRMLHAGFPIFVATEYVGEAQRNSLKGTYHDYSLTRRKRLKLLFSPKGLPVYSYFRYHIKTSRIKEFPKYIYGYVSIIVYILLNKEFKKSR